jgi:transcription termination/antitermination protein NusG
LNRFITPTPKDFGAPAPQFYLNPAWYVIHARHQHEAKVELILQRKGLRVFLPRITVRSRRRDRKLLLEAPLFPGYLFVHSALDDPTYYGIINQKSVVRLLGGKSGLPTPVPEEVVASINAIVDSHQPYYPWPYLQRGKQVCITEGPLAGTVGVIVRTLDKKHRLVVAVELFQRSVAVELAEEVVEPWN